MNSPCQTKDRCTYLAGDVKKRFDTSNYEVKRPLSIRQNKKKDRTDEKIIMMEK